MLEKKKYNATSHGVDCEKFTREKEKCVRVSDVNGMTRKEFSLFFFESLSLSLIYIYQNFIEKKDLCPIFVTKSSFESSFTIFIKFQIFFEKKKMHTRMSVTEIAIRKTA